MKRKVIHLSEHKDYTRYNQVLSELHTTLAHTASRIYDDCVQLAMLGKWRQWSDEQAIGSQIALDDKMLKETGDSNIKILLDLSEYLRDLNKKLKPKPGAQLKKSDVSQIDTICKAIRALLSMKHKIDKLPATQRQGLQEDLKAVSSAIVGGS